MAKLTIVVGQINLTVGDMMGNAERIIINTQKAIEQFQADLVVFPELSLSGYPAEDLLFRHDFLQRCEQALKKIQQAQLPTTLIVGYPCKVNENLYNQAAVIQNGLIIANYAKQELPNYTVFDEKRYFQPGESSCVFELKSTKIALLICEDLWFPGPPQRAIEAGGDLIIVINASPFDRNKARARETILMARAQETHTPIIYTNLVGGQDELVFDGGSMVVNRYGQCCQRARFFVEELMPIILDTSNPDLIIGNQSPPLALSDEENIYQALVLGVRDYIGKNNFPGAFIGLSGGIDSSLTLAITVDAIGADRVEGVLMPSRYTSQMSNEDAEQQAKIQGVRTIVINIDTIFQDFLQSLAPSFTGLPTDTTEENLQARIRGTLLMALSNKKGGIVLTTGNKSEMSVGYATLYGDMAGGFSVLKDVPKTLVYRLANYRNSLSTVIPQRVIERPPSAELALGQRDEDSLPPYAILDEILIRYIEFDQSPEMIYETGIDKTIVDSVIRMINRNEYKRRQAPVGIRITQRAFGKDRRYPITSGWK